MSDRSDLAAASSPAAGMSPRKSPSHSSPLPPLSSDILAVSKRRRLEPSSPLTDLPVLASDNNSSDTLLSSNRAVSSAVGGSSTITPSKQRVVTSPVSGVLSGHRARRTPSLQDRPIPVLSPPSPPPAPQNVQLSPGHRNRNATSPPRMSVPDKASIPRLDELRRQELDVDRELARWKRLVETAEQAARFARKQDEDARFDALTSQWREAAQEAALELFEIARQRADTDGVAAMRRRLKRAPLGGDHSRSQSSSDDDDDDQADGNSSREFTVADMLCMLQVDPKTVFPDGVPS